MSEYQDPAWLVQRAWSLFRLSTLQKMVEGTIADLQRIDPNASSERPAMPAGVNILAHDPVAEALKACVEELRDASGMVDAGERRAAHCALVRCYIAEQPAVWGETFGVALDEYRRAASLALQASLSATPPGSGVVSRA